MTEQKFKIGEKVHVAWGMGHWGSFLGWPLCCSGAMNVTIGRQYKIVEYDVKNGYRLDTSQDCEGNQFWYHESLLESADQSTELKAARAAAVAMARSIIEAAEHAQNIIAAWGDEQ